MKDWQWCDMWRFDGKYYLQSQCLWKLSAVVWLCGEAKCCRTRGFAYNTNYDISETDDEWWKFSIATICWCMVQYYSRMIWNIVMEVRLYLWNPEWCGDVLSTSAWVGKIRYMYTCSRLQDKGGSLTQKVWCEFQVGHVTTTSDSVESNSLQNVIFWEYYFSHRIGFFSLKSLDARSHGRADTNINFSMFLTH